MDMETGRFQMNPQPSCWEAIVLATSSSPLQVCECCLEGDETAKRNTLLSCGTEPELLASADVQLKLFAQELQFEILSTQLVLSCVKISRGSS